MRPLEPWQRMLRAAITSSALLPISVGCQPPPPLDPVAEPSPVPPPPSARGTAQPAAALGTPVPANARHYSWEDLRALESQEAWVELREHLEDLAPAERNDEWKSLVERTAVASLVEAETPDALALAERADDLARRYPSLKSSARFRAAAGDVTARGVAASARDADLWARCPALVTFLEKVVRDPKATARAGAAAAQNGHRQLAMALYRSSTDAKSVCDSDQALTLAMEGRSKAPDSKFHQDAEAVLAMCRKLKGSK
ncbi:MAG: hypothetical protein JNK04_08755 [Myxococcales bacterium]|nr:hypothetical protein [Myxococcales bacterium]